MPEQEPVQEENSGGLLDGPVSSEVLEAEKKSEADSSALKTDSSVKKDGGVPEWKMLLSDEIKNDPALKTIHDIQSLAKSYVHAQKLVGADKVAIPGKFASEEDIHNFYKKVGKPDISDAYQIKDESADQKFVKEFKDAAFKVHLTQKQVDGLYKWFVESTKAINQTVVDAQQKEQQQALMNLKAEWGQGYDANLARARAAIKEYCDENDLKHLKAKKYVDDPGLVRIFAKIGKTFDEDKIIGYADGPIGLTPAEIVQKKQEIMGDVDGAYWNKHHPNHAAAVAEVEKLNRWVYESQRRKK